jgi:hypothetical protein
MSTGPLPIYQLTRAGSTIQITDAYTACAQHSDCQLVGTSCNGCCAQGAIQSNLNDQYITNMTAACADYEGGVCDCSFEDLVPRCEDDRCAAVPRSELVCYSPEMPETAYDDGAVGCLCDEHKEKTICMGREALICQPAVDSHYAWVAVEDGPCGEPVPDPDCKGGGVRATATACLDDFFMCWRLDTGEYCGLVDTP